MGDLHNTESNGQGFVMRHSEVETHTGPVRISFLVCEPLERAGFLNAFSTRGGGTSPFPSNALNLSHFKADSKQNVAENRRRFLNAIGAPEAAILTGRQTHSTERCVIESPDEATANQPACDAMTTKLAGVMLAIQTADCLPILICDPEVGTIAAIHAGWRGTAGRITERTIADLIRVHGVNPRKALAALGPAACVDCYEVGSEVIERYKKEFGYWRKLLPASETNGKARLDIRAANIQQFGFCGVTPDRIFVAPYCTMHHNELFFSYRREGNGQPSRVGRLLSVIYRPDRAGAKP